MTTVSRSFTFVLTPLGLSKSFLGVSQTLVDTYKEKTEIFDNITYKWLKQICPLLLSGI